MVLDNSTMTLAGGNLAIGQASDAGSGLFLINGAHFSSGANAAIAAAGLLSSGPAALSSLFISSGSTYVGGGGGINTVSGKVSNYGTIDLQDNVAGDVFTVGGDYAGGGQILVDIDASSDLADHLEIAGDVVKGGTAIRYSELSGLEGSGSPIKVIHVVGATSADDFTADSFSLGAYVYSLVLDGQTWQFDPRLTTAGTVYPVLPGLLADFTRQSVGTRLRRSGQWHANNASANEQVFGASSVLSMSDEHAQAVQGGFWLRGLGNWSESEGVLAGGANERISYERNIRGVQGGVDAELGNVGDTLLTAGLTAQFGEIDGSARQVSPESSSGSAQTSAWGFGGTLLAESPLGYGELVGGWNSYALDTSTADDATGNTEGEGYYLSAEGGRVVHLQGGISLVPQAQLAWIGTEIDGFTASDGTVISYESEYAVEGRLGLGLQIAAGSLAGETVTLNGVVNLWQEFGDPAVTFVSGQALDLVQSGGSIETGAGIRWGAADRPLHVFAEAAYRGAIRGDGESGRNATGGFRLAF
jgi:outer membrane autotransporter protein